MENTPGSSPSWKEINARIQNYLVSGGLFNPEFMEHEKVRDLLLSIYDKISEYGLSSN